MPRDITTYLEDILLSIKRIEKYSIDLSFEDFQQNTLVQDAIVRNLEIIGEAIKQIPKEFHKKNSTIEWKKIGGLRDILIHAHFGFDLFIIWDIVENKLESLKKEVKKITLIQKTLLFFKRFKINN